jgi:hypothetical protein
VEELRIPDLRAASPESEGYCDVATNLAVSSEAIKLVRAERGENWADYQLVITNELSLTALTPPRLTRLIERCLAYLGEPAQTRSQALSKSEVQSVLQELEPLHQTQVLRDFNRAIPQGTQTILLPFGSRGLSACIFSGLVTAVLLTHSESGEDIPASNPVRYSLLISHKNIDALNVFEKALRQALEDSALSATTGLGQDPEALYELDSEDERERIPLRLSLQGEATLEKVPPAPQAERSEASMEALMERLRKEGKIR